jgi:hypothetical protein
MAACLTADRSSATVVMVLISCRLPRTYARQPGWEFLVCKDRRLVDGCLDDVRQYDHRRQRLKMRSVDCSGLAQSYRDELGNTGGRTSLMWCSCACIQEPLPDQQQQATQCTEEMGAQAGAHLEVSCNCSGTLQLAVRVTCICQELWWAGRALAVMRSA